MHRKSLRKLSGEDVTWSGKNLLTSRELVIEQMQLDVNRQRVLRWSTRANIFAWSSCGKIRVLAECGFYIRMQMREMNETSGVGN